MRPKKQLDQIFNYIAEDSALYAYRTVEKIIERTESIVPHSQKGRMVPEYERDDIREVFQHPYRIIYLIKDQEKINEILSVIHGARLLPEEIE
ncbi:MAG: type II toxin-antitoxin system RelE/ParE family toxin [Balneolales bacterium]|nr:type II toxin-antitoxin system RelE/ParE family toxin [Balneolales bacterium]